MEKLTQHFAHRSLKSTLLTIILVGSVLAAINVTLFLALYNQLIYNVPERIRNSWFDFALFAVFAIAIIGSLAILVLTTNAAAKTFYRIKLAKPLAQLQIGVTHIKQQNLAFSLRATSTDELGELVQAFETMRTTLQRSLQDSWRLTEDQKELNAAFAHDLRTPLTVLQGNLEMIQFDPTLNKETHAELEQMQAELLRINQFVDMMSKITSVQQLPLHPTRIDPTVLFKQFESEGKQLAAEKQLIWSRPKQAAETRSILVDVNEIREVFENQLTNAIRFANETVSITLSYTDKQMKIEVFNDGPLLSPAELAQATVPFFTNNRSNQHTGSGMFICKTICTQHAGDFQLRNTDGGVVTIATFGYLSLKN